MNLVTRHTARTSMLPLRHLMAVVWLALLLGSVVPVSAQGHAPEPDYLDDRSTPEAVVASYYNAINHHEYVRAYSYWEPNAAAMQLPDFPTFQQGYADTASVELAMGDVHTGVGAGQLYFTVPITLVATLRDGTSQTFVGCYTMHLSRPSLQAMPPFRPLGIQRATLDQVDDGADTTALMVQACPAV